MEWIVNAVCRTALCTKLNTKENEATELQAQFKVSYKRLTPLRFAVDDIMLGLDGEPHPINNHKI